MHLNDFMSSLMRTSPPNLPPASLVVQMVKNPRILEWVAYPSPADLPQPGTEPGSPALQADSLLTELSGKP